MEAHSKASNIETPDWVIDYALVRLQPPRLPAHALTGLEMNYFLHETGVTPRACAAVVSESDSALRNPIAAYPLGLTTSDVSVSPYLSCPAREMEVARRGDGCVVIVLGSERREAGSKPVWVTGVGFATDSPTLESSGSSGVGRTGPGHGLSPGRYPGPSHAGSAARSG